MSESRIINSKKNIFSGIVKQILGIVLPFIIRTIVINYLGSSYQGISGLFTSILNMLSLAEMGFSAAVVYSLYKPIAENNIRQTSLLVNYLKRIYRIIGIAILLAGLLLTPFLNYLVTGDIPNDVNIYIVYFIYLFNTGISYLLFAYRSAVFIAMQKESIVNNIANISTILIRLIQIVVLIFVRDFYLYVLMIPVGTILNNIVVEIFARKQMPRYEYRSGLDEETKKQLSKQIRALFISKLADTARNSFDIVVISMYIGLNSITVYDNYLYILTAIRGFLLVIVSAMQASVGNSIVKESVEKNYSDFKIFTFVFMVVSGICTICLCSMYQPFMAIWIGENEQMILPGICVLLFGLYFYVLSMDNTINLYFHGNGFYHECRWWYVIEALSNLVLNLLLCKLFGIVGILCATIISLFLFNFLPRTFIVFKLYFKRKATYFLFTHFVFFLITFASLILVIFVCKMFDINHFASLVINFVISVLTSFVIYLLCLVKTDDFSKSVIFCSNALKLKKVKNTRSST